MNGIDISNHQNGINLNAVPWDFVIIKVTQGTSYVSPDHERQIKQAINAGKPFGVYHYIGGQGAEAEADWFIKNAERWIGAAVLVVDWEQNQNSAWNDYDYLKRVVNRIKDKTDIIPLVYASHSLIDWNVVSDLNSGAWQAQYADNNITGYQDTPWNEGSYSCVIRQYSSHGRLPGYGGNLDLNKAYINAEVWGKYANPDGVDYVPDPDACDTTTPVSDLAVDVLNGEYGSGDERKEKLGCRYQEVQDFINHIYFESAETLAKEVWSGVYGNSDKRKTLLGNRYDEVMSVVNDKATSNIYVVKSGDTLSGIANKYGTTYQEIARKNGLSNPNLIYPGMRLTI